MTLFDHPAGVEPELDDEPDASEAPGKRPSRWSVSNWPVRWKVVAIALVPMTLAMVFGGLRIADAVGDASRLQLAADRVEMVPVIADYMSALGNALVATSSDVDAQGAAQNYRSRKGDLTRQLARTDVAADVRSGVTTVLEQGQALLDKVSSHQIGLREQVTSFAPILLTAEDAINGSVRIDDARIRAQTEGLSRAVGARGQMTMQKLLVSRGGDLPGAELRTSMIGLAGTEPSTLIGMSQVLGVGSSDASTLQKQLTIRLGILTDPASVLVGSPDLLRSIETTDGIAGRVIEDTTATVLMSVRHQAADRRTAAIRDTALVLTALLIALVVVLLVARSLVRPLRVLRDGALRVAHTDLEQEIARVRSGDEREPDPLPVYSTEEIGQVAHAVDELHTQALLLAGDEARLRLLVNDMFETMSRRNRSLVDQQLTLIDRLERDEDDPDRLDSLFRLDHLAARMRRNGANLLVLADAPTSGDFGRQLPVTAVINAAISEVEDYRRVETAAVPDATVIGAATGDIAHLLAELIDNALRYSPPVAPVRISGRPAGDGGVLVEVVDPGLGMTDADLRVANMRLGAGGEVTPDNARHMGLFVAGRLAQRHGMRVWLRPTDLERHGSGITAEVHLPPSLLVEQDVGGEAVAERAPHPGGPAVALLPQRTPGSSGIADVPARPAPTADQRSRGLPSPWWEQQVRRSAEPQQPPAPASEPQQPPAPAAEPQPAGPAVEPQQPPAPAARRPAPAPAEPSPSRTEQPVSADAEDVIYQRMLAEFLGDPYELAHSADLDWESVWDHGWTAAAEVESVPVVAHTEHGLPVREPGARLVPGAATPANQEPAHAPRHLAAERDPDAVRASIASHFGGVHAGRSHARHEGSDQ